MSANPLFGLAVIAGIAALLYSGGRRLLQTAQRLGETTRANALAGPAAQLGLVAVPNDPLADLPPFELLNTGTNRHASNVMRGSVSGTPVVVFDYAFTDATRADERFRGLHYRQDLAGATVCCLKGSWLSLPRFVMEPSLGASLKQAETAVDQQLGSGPIASAAHAVMQAAERRVREAPGFEFTDRPDVGYRFRGTDEQAIRARFTTAALDYFRGHPGWIVEGQGDWLLLTIALNVTGAVVRIETGPSARTGGQLPPDQLETLVTAATDTLRMFQATVSR